MYYYGGYSQGGCGCSNNTSYQGGYGYSGGYGSGAAIILVLFILLVIIIGTRTFVNV